jgi:hypothetical protein
MLTRASLALGEACGTLEPSFLQCEWPIECHMVTYVHHTCVVKLSSSRK